MPGELDPPWEGPGRTTFYEDSREGKPWENRWKFNEPLKTWSGKVIYFRKRHPFTPRDVERITERVAGSAPVDEGNWVYRILFKYWKMFYDFYRPMFETIGLGKIYDIVAAYTFERAESMVEEGIGQVVDVVQDALTLIESLNSEMPIERRLAIITEQENEDNLATISDLENALAKLQGTAEDAAAKIDELNTLLGEALNAI
jgi:hypothetical protein